ncbi:MAG: proton-conducting transporter membrane subunit [bacterium]|nr:proton-conducting transporter membrane subunit [bacterium]
MILYSFLFALLTALLSLFIRREYNYIRWILYSAVLASLTFLIYTMNGLWGYSESFKLLSVGSVDFSLNFKVTPLSWLFSFFTTGLSLSISLFSIVKNRHEESERSIGFFWLILSVCNIAIFLSADLLTLFIFWEAMTFVSFFVISPGWTKSFKAVNYYFILSILGAFAMLVGIFFLYSKSATFNIESNIAQLFVLYELNSPQAIFITLMFVLGFFTKSALMPFHIWPAEAHSEAPDDFSSYLSGIMIKYGLYGSILFLVPLFVFISKFSQTQPMSNHIPLFSHILAWVGAITSVVATFLAVKSNDMKRLAAWSTVGNIGYAATSIFILSSMGVAGGIFHIINHAIFKTAIFLSLAAVKYRTHEREMHRLGGLAYKMPVTFLTFLLGIIAAAGIPPLNGYASKWMIYQSLLSGRFPFLATMIFLSSTGAFMYLFRALHSVFLGQLPSKFDDVKEVPFLMQIPMYILMLLMVIIGIFPGTVLLPVNSILKSMNMEEIKVTYTTMYSMLSSVDAPIVFLVFAGSFAFAFILYLIGKPRRHVELLDNYTAGQDPKEFGLTREMYHFALKFYEPFEHMFDKYPRTNTKEFYDSFERKINETGSFIKKFYSSSPRSAVYIFTLSIVLIIIYGWLVW